MIWSPSRLACAEGGCPAKLALTSARPEDKATVPSDVRARGTEMHRVFEAAQRLRLRDPARPLAGLSDVSPEAAIERAIRDAACSAEVATLARKWQQDGGLIMGHVIGLELGGGLDAHWRWTGFKSPDARLRFILDRLEAIWDDELSGYILKVTDWKSGYSGWSRYQEECYVLAAHAWADAHADDLLGEILEIRAQIYSPATIGHDEARYDRTDAELEPLQQVLLTAIEAGERLLQQPHDLERLGPGCLYCDRQQQCKAFQRLPHPDAVQVQDPATAAFELARFVALDEAKESAARRLRGWVTHNGPIPLGESIYARHPRDTTEPAALEFWVDVLPRVLPGVEPAALDQAAEALARICPPGKQQLETAQRALRLKKADTEHWSKPAVEHKWGVK